MRFSASIAAIGLALIVCAFAFAGERGSEPLIRTHTAMGTEFSVTAYPPPGRAPEELSALFDEAFAAVDELESEISSWIPDSQTSYVNNHAADGPVRVSADLLDLLLDARSVYRLTDGAFDCTVGPLAKLYGLYDKRGVLPADDEIEAAVQNVGMDKVDLNAKAGTVRFARPGMRLDFGGIGKGYAVDRIVAILRARGIERALVHGGTSSVYALGGPPDAPGWTVHIRHPYNADLHVATVVLRDESLSTSGCYGDLPRVDGVRICNIFDPRTGRPQHGVLSASAIGPTATETDGLATAFLVMGVDGTRRFCEASGDIRAIVVPEAPEGELSPVRIGTREQP